MAGLILPHRGLHPKIAEDVFIAETAVVIGDVEIGAGSSIWYGCVLRGDVNRIRVGGNTHLQDGTIVHACTVGDGAFIGMRSVILDRAVVEPRAMVAAGAVVTPGKTVPSGQIWAGLPARYWRDMSAAEIAEAAWIAEHYRELGASYLTPRTRALAGPEDSS